MAGRKKGDKGLDPEVAAARQNQREIMEQFMQGCSREAAQLAKGKSWREVEGIFGEWAKLCLIFTTLTFKSNYTLTSITGRSIDYCEKLERVLRSIAFHVDRERIQKGTAQDVMVVSEAELGDLYKRFSVLGGIKNVQGKDDNVN